VSVGYRSFGVVLSRLASSADMGCLCGKNKCVCMHCVGQQAARPTLYLLRPETPLITERRYHLAPLLPL